MQTDISSMVDEFIAGSAPSDANLSFSLTKEQLQKIRSTFKPTSNEDNILFEFEASGQVTCSLNDKGITAWCKFSITELNLNGENYQSFYLDKSRVNKLTDVCQGQISFVVSNGQMQAKVGTTDLHISLPMYDAAVDISFDETSASETKTSDEVAILASRLAASKATGAFTLPVMSLKDKWYYGNTQSVTIAENGFNTEGFELNVAPNFFDFIANIPFTKEDVKFSRDETNSSAVISSDNVFYKIALQMVEFDDVTPILDEENLARIIIDTPDTLSKLQILSIPLIGQDNSTFTLDHNEDKDNQLTITVRDEANRISSDNITFKEGTGIPDFTKTTLSIQAYSNAVNAMQPLDLQVEFKESAVVFTDSAQKTIILKFL